MIYLLEEKSPLQPEPQRVDDPAPPAYTPSDEVSTTSSRTLVSPKAPSAPLRVMSFRSEERTASSSSASAAASQLSLDELGIAQSLPSSNVDLPSATHPTVVLAIPFPDALNPSETAKNQIPPFVLYAPLAAPLKKPAQGEKESRVHKAQRMWQEEERQAGEKGTGFKAKTVELLAKGISATQNSRIEFLARTPNKKKLRELRIVFPASYCAKDIKERFADLLKKTRSGAIRNGIISTAMLPFVLTFDILTFITGSFEINAVWAASSWTSAVRASTISSRVTSHNLPVHLTPDARLDELAHRLHEICWQKARPHTVHKPSWTGAGPVRCGPDLGGAVLDVLHHYGEDTAELETDRWLVAEDVEKCLKKGAREWLEVVSS